MKVIYTGTDIGHDTCRDYLTLHKAYDVIEESSFYSPELGYTVTLYFIVCDSGKTCKRNSRLFVSLEEWRSRQIEKIL